MHLSNFCKKSFNPIKEEIFNLAPFLINAMAHGHAKTVETSKPLIILSAFHISNNKNKFFSPNPHRTSLQFLTTTFQRISQ